MASFANDPMISKIRKLLQQAEGAARLGNTEEANAFNEKATELITKYGVDQAKLAAEGQIDDPIASEHVAIPDTYAVDMRNLIFNITVALGGQMVYLKRRRPGTAQSYTYTAHIFGHRSTLDRVIFLFDLLQSQMLVGASAAQVPAWENARSYRKSWMAGFAIAIRDRLSRNEQKAAAESNSPAISSGIGMELVLLDRSKAVEASFSAAYPKGTVSKSYRTLRGSGRSHGYAAGQRANIGNAVGNNRKVLVG
jgi:uncharacterized protein DUF2786